MFQPVLRCVRVSRLYVCLRYERRRLGLFQWDDPYDMLILFVVEAPNVFQVDHPWMFEGCQDEYLPRYVCENDKSSLGSKVIRFQVFRQVPIRAIGSFTTLQEVNQSSSSVAGIQDNG